ncbi:F-box/kelch-repeat protein-like [Dorcoceras hygrometricum]|uniref:F-box/kelch-repeat protein-like n=1 Tax=Dorcoceras hygrometricum TaxID=472368 RepID=A0A2Z7A1T4_9LAMI|nr:F-box/kelch-repeat protein-like [Dorcoceras hygrometricum]
MSNKNKNTDPKPKRRFQFPISGFFQHKFVLPRQPPQAMVRQRKYLAAENKNTDPKPKRRFQFPISGFFQHKFVLPRQPPQAMVRQRKYLAAEVSFISHCRCKRCARKRQKRCLPQEMVFHILLKLPALVIGDVMRHVCREWNLMIRSPDFIHHHLRNSNCGILLQPIYPAQNGIYIEIRGGCLEIFKFDCGLEFLGYNSCNGLVLVPHPTDGDVVCVSNPLTKQQVFLPPYFGERGPLIYFALAFVEASMEYKVVNACCREPFTNKQIAVLTIGVDRVWRHIDIEHLPLTTRAAFRGFPLVTGGYVHWIGKTFVLTLNVETVTFCEFPMPRLEERFGDFLPMGSNLSVVYGSNKFFKDVWEMNSETGEWTKLLSFDLEPVHYRLKDFFGKYKELIILGWLAVREVLALSTSYDQTRCIAYNLKTGEIQSFDLDTYGPNNDYKRYHCLSHVNSLVCLEGGLNQIGAKSSWSRKKPAQRIQISWLRSNQLKILKCAGLGQNRWVLSHADTSSKMLSRIRTVQLRKLEALGTESIEMKSRTVVYS